MGAKFWVNWNIHGTDEDGLQGSWPRSLSCNTTSANGVLGPDTTLVEHVILIHHREYNEKPNVSPRKQGRDSNGVAYYHHTLTGSVSRCHQILRFCFFRLSG